MKQDFVFIENDRNSAQKKTYFFQTNQFFDVGQGLQASTRRDKCLVFLSTQKYKLAFVGIIYGS